MGTPIQSAGCTPPSPAPFWTDLLKSFNRVGCQETVGRWFAVEVALARDLPPMPVPNINRLSVYRLALTTRFVVVKRWEGLYRPKIAHTPLIVQVLYVLNDPWMRDSERQFLEQFAPLFRRSLSLHVIETAKDSTNTILKCAP